MWVQALPGCAPTRSSERSPVLSCFLDTFQVADNIKLCDVYYRGEQKVKNDDDSDGDGDADGDGDDVHDNVDADNDGDG